MRWPSEKRGRWARAIIPSRPDLPVASKLILKSRELFQANWPSRMQAASGNANLGPEAEFASIGELSGGIVNDERAIEFPQKSLGSFPILRNDGIGMLRAEAANMLDRLGNPFNRPYRHNSIEIFRAPIGRVRRKDARIKASDFRTATNLATGFKQTLDDGLTTRHSGAVDEDGFGGSANARAAHLAVHANRRGLGHVGVLMDINMANSFKVTQDRDARLALHAGDERFAAARYKNVNRAIKPR